MSYETEKIYGGAIVKEEDGTVVAVFPRDFKDERKAMKMAVGYQNLLIAMKEAPDLEDVISRLIGGSIK